MRLLDQGADDTADGNAGNDQQKPCPTFDSLRGQHDEERDGAAHDRSFQTEVSG
jgi:hypothetical protein